MMSDEALSVLLVASEATPLAQTGGLAEVAGSLPLALRDAGCHVAVALPAYQRITRERTDLEVAARDIPVKLGALHLTADILRTELAPDIPAFLIRRDELFDRSGMYGGDQGEYYDNPERFIFFSRAIPAMCPRIGFVPDVILANDWQAGLVMTLLELGALPRTAGVFAIHNIGYLGLVPAERSDNIGLPQRYYDINGLEYFGQMSLLKAGVTYSQAVTTVSPTYAHEIQTPEGGHGLDGLMRSISHKLFGILNGVDYSVWNPARDPHLTALYSPDDLTGKPACKRELLKTMGMNLPEDRPLVGMVTRLTPQKGFNLVVEAADDLFKHDLGLVVLGAGESHQEEMLQQLRQRYPGRVGMKLGFDIALSHQIMAGCDMLLMPSMYEPCGLSQMYALKYGTVPIVRATGGLNDTILDPNGGNGQGTGFKFGSFQSRQMLHAVRRAMDAFSNPEQWRRIMLAGMAADFSWGRSARDYISVFEQALKRRRER